MSRENWEKVLEGSVKLDNDANDYYISWANIYTDEGDFEELCEKYLNADYDAKPIIVKVRAGAIFIILKGKQ